MTPLAIFLFLKFLVGVILVLTFLLSGQLTRFPRTGNFVMDMIARYFFRHIMLVPLAALALYGVAAYQSLEGTYYREVIWMATFVNAAGLLYLIVSGEWRYRRWWTTYFSIGVAGLLFLLVFPDIAMMPLGV